MKKILVKLLISLTILFFIIKTIDFKIFESFEKLSKPTYILITLIIPIFIIPLIVNNRWKIFLKALNINEHFLSLLKINFVSAFLGFLLPSSIGYDTIRIYYIEKRHKNRIGSGGASVLIERLFGFIILCFLGLFGSLYVLFKDHKINLLISIGLINVFLLLVLLIIQNNYLYAIFSTCLSKIRFGKKIVKYISSIYDAVNHFPFKKTFIPSAPLIVLFQLSTITCGCLVFNAFNISIPFYYHLAFLPLIQIMAILPVSISGFGIREGGFIYFYGMIGVDGSTALLASLLYYAILALVPVLIGLVLYITDSDYKKVKQELLTE